MTSLRDKLKAAKAMSAQLSTASKAAEEELSAKVDAAPEVDELSQGPAKVGNNQESPMAKLRARMAAKKAALAEPKEAKSVADALEKQTIEYEAQEPEPEQPKEESISDAYAKIDAYENGEDWEEPVEDEGFPSVDDVDEEAPAQTLEEQVAEERREARRKLEEEAAAKQQAAEKTARHVASASTGGGSLKERLAAKKAMREREQQAKLHKPLPSHTAPTRTPKTHPVASAGAQKALEATLEQAERKRVHRENGSLRPKTKAEAEQSAAPEEKPMSLAERLRAKRKAAAEITKPTPAVATEAVDKSIESFAKTQLPAQPQTAAPKATAPVQVEETGIQGAPQVKAMEEESNVAANRQQVILNAKQRETTERYVDNEESCVMIGAAGTGKTTGVRGVIYRLIETEKLEYTADYKRQGGSGLKDRVRNQPNVAICAFTRRASINIMESITSQPGLEEFKYCCQTVHNLLEFAPEYYEAYDDETGEWVNKMRFVPHRTSANRIDCDWLIIEEASMIDLNLWSLLMDALKPGTKVLFLGDINQLPPVFGLPILVYAMHKLPVVQLTEVYRQSVGPVLRNAHNILRGEHVVEEVAGDQAFVCYEEYKTDSGKTSLKHHNADKGTPIMAGESKMSSIYTALFEKLFMSGRYDPEQDMIISPFNVGDLGTLHMNQCLAQFIGDARGAVVHEVVAGFHKHYLAVGDKVMVERQDGYISAIHHNTDYMGSLPKPAGNDLSRFGVRILGRNGGDEEIDLDEAGDVNFDLNAIGEKSAEELKRAASHVVEVTLESGETVVLSTSGQFAPEKFTLGYCITGHKSQGSEWRNVYIIMHKKHHSLLTREWLYTTVTRSRKQCTLMCKPFSIEKALAVQRIAGDTIEDKLEWFTSGAVDNLDEVEVTP